MTGRRVLTAVLAICVVTTAMTIGGLAPVEPVAAQDDEVPSIPAVYYGELTVDNGSLPGSVTIEAVADGEVQDTIQASPDGTFGGPTISDDGLEVQEPDSGEVTFRIGDTPVTVVRLGDESIGGTTMPWDSGTQEVILEVDAETVAPSTSVTVTNAPATIEAGTDATIDADIENTGVVDVSQDIELVDENNTVIDSEPVSLPTGDTTSVSLTYPTEETRLNGTETLAVRSEQDSANVTIEIEAIDTPPIAPPPGSGGGSGGDGGDGGDGSDGSSGGGDGGDGSDGSSGGGDGGDGSDGSSGGGGGAGAVDDQPDDDGTDGSDTDGTDTTGDLTESQPIVTSEEFGLSQVRFTTESNIVAITWEGTDFNGSVTATTFAQPPESVSAVPGAMATISDVTAADETATEPAIVEQRVTRERIEEINASVGDLQGYRYTNDTWEPVPTTVAEESGDEIILETEVAELSPLAVSAVGEPTATIDAPTEVTTAENVTLDAGASTSEYGEITAYEWTVNGESFSGETVTTAFETTGEVTAELTVTNDAGRTNTATTTITVEEPDGLLGTDESIPGFTGGLTLVAILLGLGIARRMS